MIQGRSWPLQTPEQVRAIPIPSSLQDFLFEWVSGAEKFLVHTSGSTGTPKPLYIQRTQMEASARATNGFLGLGAGTRSLIALPTEYIGGKMMCVRGLLGGHSMVLLEPSLHPLLHYNEPFDFIALIPAQLQQTLSQGMGHRLEHCRAILIGGGAMSAEQIQVAESLQAPIYATYGMTETVSHIALRRINGTEKSPYFTAFEEVSLRVDERNCLAIQSAVTGNEWIQTNDVVRMLDSHRFEWLGRADFVINSGGLKLHPEQLEAELERLLAAQGMKLHFFFYGVEDATWGQKLVLFVREEGIDEEQKQRLAQIAQQVEKKQQAKSIVYCKEWVMTPTGKVNRIETVKRNL